MRRALIGCLVLVVLSLANRALAGDIEDFETARHAYDAHDFPRAVYAFEQLVGGETPRLRTPALIWESRKYLGAAYLFVGRREAARTEFERLLRERPDYQLDRNQFPLEILDLFASVRERLASERREEEARNELRSRAEAEAERAARLLALADEVEVQVENSRLLAMVPFGVGQFQNGQDDLGWFFLVTEVVLGAASIGSLIWHQELSAQVRHYQNLGSLGTTVADGNRLLEAAFIAHWVTNGALLGTLIGGILQAQIEFVPHRTVVQRGRVPEDLRTPPSDAPIESASLHISPVEMSLTLRF